MEKERYAVIMNVKNRIHFEPHQTNYQHAPPDSHAKKYNNYSSTEGFQRNLLHSSDDELESKPKQKDSHASKSSDNDGRIEPEKYFQTTNHHQRFAKTRAIFAQMEHNSLLQQKKELELQRSRSPARSLSPINKNTKNSQQNERGPVNPAVRHTQNIGSFSQRYHTSDKNIPSKDRHQYDPVQRSEKNVQSQPNISTTSHASRKSLHREEVKEFDKSQSHKGTGDIHSEGKGDWNDSSRPSTKLLRLKYEQNQESVKNDRAWTYPRTYQPKKGNTDGAKKNEEQTQTLDLDLKDSNVKLYTKSQPNHNYNRFRQAASTEELHTVGLDAGKKESTTNDITFLRSKSNLDRSTGSVLLPKRRSQTEECPGREELERLNWEETNENHVETSENPKMSDSSYSSGSGEEMARCEHEHLDISEEDTTPTTTTTKLSWESKYHVPIEKSVKVNSNHKFSNEVLVTDVESQPQENNESVAPEDQVPVNEVQNAYNEEREFDIMQNKTSILNRYQQNNEETPQIINHTTESADSKIEENLPEAENDLNDEKVIINRGLRHEESPNQSLESLSPSEQEALLDKL